jgi:hypothetical protein
MIERKVAPQYTVAKPTGKIESGVPDLGLQFHHIQLFFSPGYTPDQCSVAGQLRSVNQFLQDSFQFPGMMTPAKTGLGRFASVSTHLFNLILAFQ